MGAGAPASTNATQGLFQSHDCTSARCGPRAVSARTGDEIDDVDDRSCYGESDVEDEEGLVDEQEDEEEPLGPGSIIWVRRRSWYPGRVVDVHNLPQGTKKYLPEHPENELIVELFPPFCDVVIAKRGRIERLNESASDKEKASKSEDVNAAYNQALAVKNGLI